MSKAIKILAMVIGALAALALLALAALWAVAAMLPLEEMASESLSEALGRPAHVERVDVGVFGSLELDVAGVRVDDLANYGQRPLLKLDSLRVELPWAALFRGGGRATGRLEGLELSVVRAADGRLNLGDMPERRAEGQEPDIKPEHADQDGPAWLKGLAALRWDLKATGCRALLTNLATGQSSSLPLTEASLTADALAEPREFALVVALPGVELRAPVEQEGLRGLALSLDLGALGQRVAVVAPGLEALGRVKLVAGRSLGQPGQSEVSLDASNILWRRPLGRHPLALADLRAQLEVYDHEGDREATTSGWLISRDGGLDWRLVQTGEDKYLLTQDTDLARAAVVFGPLVGLRDSLMGKARKVTTITMRDNSLEFEGHSTVRDLTIQGEGMAEPWFTKSIDFDYETALDITPDEPDEVKVRIDRLAMRAPWAQLNLAGEAEVDGNDLTFGFKLSGERLDLCGLPPVAFSALLPPYGGGGAVDGRLDLAIAHVLGRGLDLEDVRGAVEFGPEAARLTEIAWQVEGRPQHSADVTLTPRLLRSLAGEPQPPER